MKSIYKLIAVLSFAVILFLSFAVILFGVIHEGTHMVQDKFWEKNNIEVCFFGVKNEGNGILQSGAGWYIPTNKFNWNSNYELLPYILSYILSIVITLIVSIVFAYIIDEV